MTNEDCRLIAERLGGFEVQVSPQGKHYIVTEDATTPLPDYDADTAETVSMAEAIARSRTLNWFMGAFATPIGPHANLGGATSYGKTATEALAACLLKLAKGDQ